MAGKKTARKNQHSGKAADARVWWEKLGLKRVRVMRPSGRTVMVWMDSNGEEYKG